MKANYTVIVGNIGTVYDDGNGKDATKTFNAYVKDSKAGYGKASGESVTFYKNDEIAKEFIGSIDSQELID